MEKKKLHEAADGDGGMTLIVRASAALLAVPITVFGIYVILHGHLTPGGGFAGGTIIATLIALFIVAAGREKAMRLSREAIAVTGSVGLLLFGILGIWGTGTTYFYNFLANSPLPFGMGVPYGANPGYMWTGGFMPLMNIAVGLEVFASLSLVAIVMYTYTKNVKEEGK